EGVGVAVGLRRRPTGAPRRGGLFFDAKPPLRATPAAELSSQYCSHRSLSRISAARRNRRMDGSPRDSFPPESSSPCANADKLPGKSPVPIVTAPATTIPFCRNRRRLAEFLRILSDFFMTFSFFSNRVCVVLFAFAALCRRTMSCDVGLGRISLADVRNSRMDKEGLSNVHLSRLPRSRFS